MDCRRAPRWPSCRPWATCTRATCRCCARAGDGRARRGSWCCRSSSTRRSSGRARTSIATRATRPAIWRRRPAAGSTWRFVRPIRAALYPNGTRTWVEVEGLDRHLCGASRPGHFRGVCTVVAKLWGLVQPSVGLFGEKDYQQLAILRRMHADLNLVGELLGQPIVREPDGLAMSSRNTNLKGTARQEALAISRYLAAVRERFAAGERDSAALLADPSQALAPGRVDYASLVDADELQPVASVAGPVLVAVAAFFGGVRLIDNTLLRP
nr:pantoate--beta-alanine ligase [Nannocystis sp.]